MRTTNSPSPGAGTGSSVKRQCSRPRGPEGRAARRTWWLIAFMETSSASLARGLDALGGVGMRGEECGNVETPLPALVDRGLELVERVGELGRRSPRAAQ